MTHLGPRFGLGLLLAVVGVLILIELIAHVGLPIVRLVFGLAVLLIGIRLITETWQRRRHGTAAGEAVLADLGFSRSGMLVEDTRFDVVLGRGTIDLSKLVEPDRDVTVTVDAVFGRAVIKLPPHMAYDIAGSAAFGQVRMPDHRAAALGSIEYRAPSLHASRLHLRVHAVFGACQVVEVPTAAEAPPAAA
jgi:predicted membrane protein